MHRWSTWYTTPLRLEESFGGASQRCRVGLERVTNPTLPGELPKPASRMLSEEPGNQLEGPILRKRRLESRVSRRSTWTNLRGNWQEKFKSGSDDIRKEQGGNPEYRKWANGKGENRPASGWLQ